MIEFKPIPDSDLEAYTDLFNDEQLARNAGTVPYPIDKAWAADRLATRRAGEAQGEMADRGLYENGQLVGSAGWFMRGNGLEVGYSVHRDQRGRGLATIACGLSVRLAREMRKPGPVFANYFQDNPASGRVLEKCGFVRTGASVATSAAREGEVPCWNTELRGDIALVDPMDEDYDALFEFMSDPRSVQQAGAGTMPTSRDAYRAQHQTAREKGAVIQTLLLEGNVAGSLAVFERFGLREISFWIGRSFMGQGLATRAVSAWIDDPRLPSSDLHARALKDNHASRRVLEKAGFKPLRTETFWSDVRGGDVEEVLFRLG